MKLIITSAFVCIANVALAQTVPANDTTIIKVSQTKGELLKGKIVDAATKKAVGGASLSVENFSATITDDAGNFSLRVPSYSSTIKVTAEGFATKLLALKGQKTIQVSLLDATHESINDPIVTPTGMQLKRNITSASGQYNVSAWTNGSETVDALLQGRIAGLNAIRRSGAIGAGANLFIRGYNSLYATSRPLIVIDNMIYDDNDYGQSIISNNYTNPLALLDVKDIDNITVLKDAASIYGSKGANGAIIITTVRAKEQATKIDFAAYAGYNFSPKRLPVLNAQDYRVYLSEMLQSKGMNSAEIAAQPYMSDDPNNPNYASYHYNTDWQNKVFQNAMTNNYYLKVTGGDNIATYGLSMGYTKNNGIIKETDFTRYNTRFNAQFNFSKKLTGFANLSYAYNEHNLKAQGTVDKTSPLFLALIKAPFMHDHEVNAKGIESPNLSDRDTLGVSNPTAVIEKMQAYNKYYRFFGSFSFNYALAKNLNASTMFGIVHGRVRENIFVPSRGVAKDTLKNAIANNKLGTQVKGNFTLYSDTKLEYSRKTTIHAFAARVGLRYQQNKTEQDSAIGYNSATDELVSVQNGLPALRVIGGRNDKWNWLNLYTGVDYGFQDRIFVSINAAMDGSSRFGKEAKNGVSVGDYNFPVMPSIGAAWLISSEEFMEKSKIDLLKLRATYSITGNDDIGNYNSRQLYSSQNFLGMQGLVRDGIANPALQWETVRKFNVGVDFAFWNERISLTADVYRNKTENMLVYGDMAAATGFAKVLTNDGGMENTGVDASINARIINKAVLKWDLGATITQYKNRVLRVPNGSFTTDYAGATLLTANGQPASVFYGYTSEGVFASDAEAAAAGLRKKNADGSFTQFMGGDTRFSDLNNDKVIDNNDRSIIGNPNPDFTGGITNRLIWKNFELNVLVTFSKNNDVFNYLRYRLESQSGVYNQLETVNNRWRTAGQVTNTPKAVYGDPMGNSRFSNRWIEDGSYLRLRSASIQYYIPVKNKIVNSASVYAIGTNLFTLTKYKGFDPEFSANSSVYAQGIDKGLEPIFKNVTLGVRLGL